MIDRWAAFYGELSSSSLTGYAGRLTRAYGENYAAASLSDETLGRCGSYSVKKSCVQASKKRYICKRCEYMQIYRFHSVWRFAKRRNMSVSLM